MNLTGSDQPETLGVMRISSGFFETLRVAPQRGRWFTEIEEKRGAPNVVILTDALWRRRFAAAPGTIGSKIFLNDVGYEVIGITPPDLRFLYKSGRVAEGAAAFAAHVDREAAAELDALAGELRVAGAARTALMCLEADPAECHRRVLADALRRRLPGLRVVDL